MAFRHMLAGVCILLFIVAVAGEHAKDANANAMLCPSQCAVTVSSVVSLGLLLMLFFLLCRP